MKSKWLKLGLNMFEDFDTETWINESDKLMLHNHIIWGWEIIPNTDDSDIINKFYNKFSEGISGGNREECIEMFER